MSSIFIALLLTYVQLGSQAWSQVIDRDSKMGVGIVSPAPAASQRLTGIFWAESSLPFAASALQAAPVTVAAVPALPATFSMQGPGVGTLFGCGLIEITRANPPVPAAIENPIFIEGKKLLADPGFRMLSKPVREKYLGEWKGLHQMQEKLDREGQGILSDLDAADKDLDRLDAVGCRVRDVIDRIEPSILTYNRICQGTVPPLTFEWCVGEIERLKPLISHRESVKKDFFQQMADYNETIARPVLRKADEWTRSVTGWEGKVLDFNQRLESALTAAPRPPGWTPEWQQVVNPDGKVRWRDPKGNVWTWHFDPENLHGNGGNHWDVGTPQGVQYWVDPVTGEWHKK